MVTFVVISQNQEKTIKRCILGIKQQSLPKKEIILIDDNSQDRTATIAKKLGARVIRNTKSLGIALSRQKGVKASKNKIVFFVDGDIEIIGDVANKIVKLLTRHKDVVAVSGYYFSPYKSGDWNNILDARREGIYLKGSYSFKYGLFDATTFSGGFCAIDFRKIGKDQLFTRGDRKSGEDLIFQIKLLNEGYKFIYYAGFNGRHLDSRNMGRLWRKLIADAKGSVWTTLVSLENKLAVPPVEAALSFPLFLVFAILSLAFLKNITMFTLFLLLEFFPCGLSQLIIRRKSALERIGLVIYVTVHSFLKVIFSFLDILVNSYKPHTTFRFILYLVYSDFVAKLSWLKKISQIFLYNNALIKKRGTII